MIIALLGMIAGCSSAQGYEFLRAAGEAKTRCELERTAAAAAACRDSFRLSYEGYRAQRQKVLGGAPDPGGDRDAPPAERGR